MLAFSIPAWRHATIRRDQVAEIDFISGTRLKKDGYEVGAPTPVTKTLVSFEK